MLLVLDRNSCLVLFVVGLVNKLLLLLLLLLPYTKPTSCDREKITNVAAIGFLVKNSFILSDMLVGVLFCRGVAMYTVLLVS